MGLFGRKKKEEPAPEAPVGLPMPSVPSEAVAAGVPTDRIIQMRQQSLSNNQITETLQREGFSSSQIFDAMSQADIKGIVEAPAEGAAPPMPAPGAPPMPPGPEMPPPPMPGAPEAMPPPMAPAPEAVTRERVEEIAESIIDEKWDELMKSIDKVIAWKEAAEKKITKLEHEIRSLKENFEELHKGILGKLGEYDKGIRNVGTEIKAMEEVFKKVLPTLTENVGELSRITKKFKKKK